MNGHRSVKNVVLRPVKLSVKTCKCIRTGERQFKWEECRVAFSQTDYQKTCAPTLVNDHLSVKNVELHSVKNGSLKMHKGTHTGDRPFQCDECSAAYSETGIQKKHMYTHTGKRPFQRYVYCAAFSQTTNIKKPAHSHL